MVISQIILNSTHPKWPIKSSGYQGGIWFWYVEKDCDMTNTFGCSLTSLWSWLCFGFFHRPVASLWLVGATSSVELELSLYRKNCPSVASTNKYVDKHFVVDLVKKYEQTNFLSCQNIDANPNFQFRLRTSTLSVTWAPWFYQEVAHRSANWCREWSLQRDSKKNGQECK